MTIDHTIEVQLAPELLRIFSLLLQEGVDVEVETGCSVKQLLTEQFGISAEYLASRITTLFLNSRAVDNAATAVVNDGGVLALSGAMPGLVGATMRSGGFYAAMRGAMTYRNENATAEAKRGRIKLKLFNLLLEELGPRVLKHGILLDSERIRDFFAAQRENFRPLGLWIDGRQLPGEQLQRGQLPIKEGDLLRFQAYFGVESA